MVTIFTTCFDIKKLYFFLTSCIYLLYVDLRKAATFISKNTYQFFFVM